MPGEGAVEATDGRKETVATVIVTRDRLAMLQECIAAVRGQTREVDEIIVIDNDSSDGTAAWLAAQPDVTVHRQANLGGAGGFRAGIEAAVARGNDWVWCMDDDGYPADDCLARLLAVGPNADLWLRAPLVLERDDPTGLAFLLRPPGRDFLRSPEACEAAAEGGFLWDVACPFNGILIHRRVVEQLGLPIGGMFLWGDETEYFLRAQRAGCRVATIVAAHFRHPKDRWREQRFTFLGRETSVVYVDQALRDYLVIRNGAFILRQYYGLRMAIRHIGRYAVFHGNMHGPAGFFRALAAGWSGLRGDWSGHQRFLTNDGR